MKTLLWVGDANCDSGFAKCTHYTLETLRHYYRVVVLGINHPGGPHKYPYDIYPCINAAHKHDVLGVQSLPEMLRKHRPDVVVLQTDPWWVPDYMDAINKVNDVPRPLVVGAIAIDGKSTRGAGMNDLDHAIFWTKFAQKEALLGGYRKGSTVIGLGVDRSIYNVGNHSKAEYRAAMGLSEECADAFIVGNVNRNQPRKRLDLTIQYFAEWIKTREIYNAYLFLHVAPTGDLGYNLESIAYQCGLHNPQRIILSTPNVYKGTSEAGMAQIFRSLDLQLHTGMGEGWGLPGMEGMACGTPLACADVAAQAEWARPAAVLLPSDECFALGGVATRGGVPRKENTIKVLDTLYHSLEARADLSQRGLDLTADTQFDWVTIGARWVDTLRELEQE